MEDEQIELLKMILAEVKRLHARVDSMENDLDAVLTLYRIGNAPPLKYAN